MNTSELDKYMNDPEIINEPMPLRQLHAIRLMIHDETKNMTVNERRAYYTDGLDELCKQYKIKVVPNARRT